MNDKKKSIKKILIFTWLLIAIPTFTATIYYNRNSSANNQKQNKPLKNEINQSTQDASTNNHQDIQGTEFSSTNPPTYNHSKPLVQLKPEPKTSFVSPIAEVKSAFPIQPSPTPSQRLSPRTAEPTPTPTILPVDNLAFVKIWGLGNYKNYKVNLKENDTAFSILIRASRENNFTIDYQNYDSLGAFVKCIAGICNDGEYYWAFYYNGQYSTKGASSQLVNNNDITTWEFEN